MRLARAACSCLALALALAAAAGGPGDQKGLAHVRTAQIPRAYSADSAAVGDLDGDGGADLVVSGVLRSDPRQRSLFLFRTASNGELGNAQQFELKLDVTAWALADVHADPGLECVLFTARGVFVMRPLAPEAERFALLLEANFLWQLPDGDAAFLWERALIDLDGDGLDDLLVPEPGGYAIAYQRRGPEGTRFEPGGRLRVPHEPAPGGTYISASGGSAGWRGQRSEAQLGLSYSISAGVDDEYALPSILLSVSETVPAPQLIDWDGDGDLDLLAQTSSRLHVWTQEQAGFEGPRSFPLPVVADRDRRLDASYSSHAVDLNGDSRADCVIFVGDNQKSEVRTQAMVFLQGAGRGDAAQTPAAPLFGPRGRPQDLLVFAGFVVRSDFVDVDGDGRPDLVISGLRPDLIDQLRSITSETIEADLFVYLNRGTAFSRRPDLSFKLNVALAQFESSARFIGDLTGDGVSELLVQDNPERIRLLMLRRQRGSPELTVVERPLWELRVHERARLVRQRVAGRALPDLLILERTQIMHVRFR